MSIDPVVYDEAKHDRDCERAREVTQARIDEEMDRINEEIDSGQWDSDMANYFDAEMLMRIVRRAANPMIGDGPMQSAELREIRDGIKEYARDMAEMRATR